MFVVIVPKWASCNYTYRITKGESNGENVMKSIAIVVYEGGEILDITGIIEVF